MSTKVDLLHLGKFGSGLSRYMCGGEERGGNVPREKHQIQ